MLMIVCFQNCSEDGGGGEIPMWTFLSHNSSVYMHLIENILSQSIPTWIIAYKIAHKLIPYRCLMHCILGRYLNHQNMSHTVYGIICGNMKLGHVAAINTSNVAPCPKCNFEPPSVALSSWLCYRQRFKHGLDTKDIWQKQLRLRIPNKKRVSLEI